MRRIGQRGAAAGGSPAISLVEVLVVLATLSLILAAVFTVYLGGAQVYARASRLSDRQEQVRAALTAMLRDLRELGYDPAGAMPALGLTTALLTADQHTLEFLGGVTRDGVTTAKVKYAYSATGSACAIGCLTRQVAPWNPAANAFASYGAATLLATSVGDLTFTYYDDAGPPNSLLAPLPLSVATRAAVRRIVIQITGAADPRTPPVVLSSSVRPRNL